MPLDPQVARFLQASAKASPEQAPVLSLAEQRRWSEQIALVDAGEPEIVASVEDRLIPGPAGTLPVRIYTPADAEQNPLPAPLRATDLSGLPPALIITAEYDPVRDEAELYAGRLQEADVPVRLSRYDGMIHSFFRMFALFEQSHQALAEVASALRAAFARGPA